MKDWQKRVLVEKEELDVRIYKLVKFLEIEDDKWCNKDKNIADMAGDIDTDAHYKQKKAMLRYSAALNERIIMFPKEELKPET